jgi:hypothetical protein
LPEVFAIAESSGDSPKKISIGWGSQSADEYWNSLEDAVRAANGREEYSRIVANVTDKRMKLALLNFVAAHHLSKSPYP